MKTIIVTEEEYTLFEVITKSHLTPRDVLDLVEEEIALSRELREHDLDRFAIAHDPTPFE